MHMLSIIRAPQFLSSLLLGAALCAPVHAQVLSGPAETFIVTTTADTDDGACDADCSLREALAAANAGSSLDTILFADALAGETLTLTLGQLGISKPLVLDGSGLDITVSGNGVSRVLQVSTRERVEIVGLTLADGFTDGPGGGVYATGGSRLTLREVTVRDNTAQDGGGISAGTGLTVIASTISGNRATGDSNGRGGGGGGLFATFATISSSTISGNEAKYGAGLTSSPFTDSYIALRNSTVVGNNATSTAGGLHSVAGIFEKYSIVAFENSIVAGNTVGGSFTAPSANCAGYNSPPFSVGYSVVDADCNPSDTDRIVDASTLPALLLDPVLADNGGPTLTHALLAPGGDPSANPAIDIGGDCGPVDQRGFLAPTDGDGDGIAACDAGAVERAAPSGSDVTIQFAIALDPALVPPQGGSIPFGVLLANTTDAPQTVQVWSEATLPDGSVRGPLIGPVTVRLAPGDTLSRKIEQAVPARAPAGLYFYTGFVGDFPDAPRDSSFFRVRKQAARGVVGPLTATAWTVIDATTGSPVLAGDRWTSDELPEVASSTSVPTAFALAAAYPNPFRSATTLSLDLPEATTVRLVVYDVLGRTVATLVDGELAAGSHALTLDGSALPSGTYLVRLTAGGFAATQRVTLIR